MSFSILLYLCYCDSNGKLCWESWPAGRQGDAFEATIFTLVSDFLQLHSSTEISGMDPQIRKIQALSTDVVQTMHLITFSNGIFYSGYALDKTYGMK